MKYFIGALITFFSITLIILLLFHFSNKIKKQKNIYYTQSRIHSMVSDFAAYDKNIKVNKNSQALKRSIENTIKVIIIDNAAYWIKDNTFYTAFIDNHGTVDKETTTVVDTMTMNSVELEKMLFIMDKLREGLDNDSGSTGK